MTTNIIISIFLSIVLDLLYFSLEYGSPDGKICNKENLWNSMKAYYLKDKIVMSNTKWLDAILMVTMFVLKTVIIIGIVTVYVSLGEILS